MAAALCIQLRLFPFQFVFVSILVVSISSWGFLADRDCVFSLVFCIVERGCELRLIFFVNFQCEPFKIRFENLINALLFSCVICVWRLRFHMTREVWTKDDTPSRSSIVLHFKFVRHMSKREYRLATQTMHTRSSTSTYSFMIEVFVRMFDRFIPCCYWYYLG